MKIVAWNVNGLRAALNKGLPEILGQIDPDVVLVQEIRCTPDQLDGWAGPPGYEVAWRPHSKKGYAGVAIWSKLPFEILPLDLPDEITDGRILAVRVGGLNVASTYLPSGSAGPERQASKEAWMAAWRPWAEARARDPQGWVIGGDLNIAHTELDIHNPKANAKNSGFLPHERAWFGEVLASGWTDWQRSRSGPVQGPYSWWSNRGRARAENRGWRIDYLLGNQALSGRMTDAYVVREGATDREGGLPISDHAPVVVTLSQ